MNFVYLDASQFEKLTEKLKQFPGDAESAINEVLHDQAGQLIYKKINPLIHPSGRTFKGHLASARESDWPHFITNESLAVTVTTNPKFNYLYFPDDGSNTRRHHGNQEFFLRGAEAASDEILQTCLVAITQRMEQF